MKQLKRVLTVNLVSGADGIRYYGVCEDQTVCRSSSFPTLIKAIQYIERHYRPTYRVVMNIPEEVRRTFS